MSDYVFAASACMVVLISFLLYKTHRINLEIGRINRLTQLAAQCKPWTRYHPMIYSVFPGIHKRTGELVIIVGCLYPVDRDANEKVAEIPTQIEGFPVLLMTNEQLRAWDS